MDQTMSVRQHGIGMTSQRTRLRMIERLREAGIQDQRVLHAMAEVPRHIFVDEALASRAYDDLPLPIGFSQTISSPYIVARMTELMRAQRSLERVLEIGTGCGYQAAILSKLAKEVYSIERISALLDRARTNLRELKLWNVRLKHVDGSQGLPDVAPFDGIMITAAISQVPQELIEQLAQGGRLVLPLGQDEQRLHLVERTEDGIVETVLEAVRFVPLLPGTARS
jgi:protein-L-isoaspartate(D-aspartate) O-methyltransferase